MYLRLTRNLHCKKMLSIELFKVDAHYLEILSIGFIMVSNMK